VGTWGREILHTGFWRGNLRGGHHLKDPSIDEMIILKTDLRKVGWGMDWIDLAQDRDRLRAVVNAVMNLAIR
jgi:hypothetical protein